MRVNRCLTSVSAIVISAALSFPAWGHNESHAKMDAIDYTDAETHPFGKASAPMVAVKTIDVGMSDMMRFMPAEIVINKGDTVRFVIRNNGQLLHEMVLGTSESLLEHAELMKKFPGMEHSEPYMAHVPVGETQMIGWQFTEAGEFAFGCLVPGHFEAGMKGTITVRQPE